MQRLLFMLSLSIASATFASLCGAHGVSGPDNAKRQVASTISYDPYSTWAYTAGEPSDGTVICTCVTVSYWWVDGKLTAPRGSFDLLRIGLFADDIIQILYHLPR